MRKTTWTWIATAASVALAAGAANAGKPGGGGGGGGGGGTISPNAAIVFVETTSTGVNLRTMELNGASPATVQANVGTESAEAGWSPGGTEIVYSAPGLAGERGRIYRRSADGTGSPTLVHVTSNTPGHRPRWGTTALGQKILFHDATRVVGGGTYRDVWVVDPNGANPKNLTASFGASWYQMPAWSPDGSRVAMAVRHVVDGATRHDVLVFDVVAGGDGNVALANPVNVTNSLTGTDGLALRALGDDANIAFQYYAPDWGTRTDGSQRIVVSAVSKAGQRDNADLWEIDPVGLTAVRLTATADVVDGGSTVGEQSPSWSGDGSAIVFWRRGKGGSQSGIWSMPPVRNGTQTPLFTGTAARDPSCR